MRKQTAFVVASLVLLLLGMGACQSNDTDRLQEQLAACQATATKAAEDAVATVTKLEAQLAGCEATVTAVVDECKRKCINGEARDCYTGPEGTKGVGVCKPGTQACVAGEWGVCEGEVTPTAEKCDDSLDNDCDGLTDTEDTDDCRKDGAISCEDAKLYYGEFKTVQGRFYASYRPDVNGEPTYLNCPSDFPNHDFTAIIWGDERPIFISCLGGEPGTLLDEREFGVNGLIEEYRGKPQIKLTKCDQLREK